MARHLSSTEVCDLLEITPKTLYAWERAGKIPRSARDRRGWRVYAPADVEKLRRFAGGGHPGTRKPPEERREKQSLSGLTARNQIRGTVVSIASEGLLSEVVLRLADGQEVVAVVTRSSVRRLGLKRGQVAMAVIKATEVMLFA